MTKRIRSWVLVFLCSACLAPQALAQGQQTPACACKMPPFKTPRDSAPAEIEGLVADQWATKSGATVNLSALNIYTDPQDNSGNPSEVLCSLVPKADNRLQGICQQVAASNDYGESVARAGADSFPALWPLPGTATQQEIKNSHELFSDAEAAIKKLYTDPAGTAEAALSKANAEFQGGPSHYLRALYLLLSAVPSSDSDECDCNQLNEIQLFRACYAIDPGKLLGFVADRFKAKSSSKGGM